MLVRNNPKKICCAPILKPRLATLQFARHGADLVRSGGRCADPNPKMAAGVSGQIGGWAQLVRHTNTPVLVVSAMFYATAVAHSAVRLSLIFSRKGTGPWWDHAACLSHDRVGVTASHVRRVARRAARWSDKVGGLRRLGAMFEAVAKKVS